MYRKKLIERRSKIRKTNSVQEWLPFDKILNNGIIVNKSSFIKIVRVIPINYDLKSNLEHVILIFKYLFKVKKKIYLKIFPN